MPLTTTALDEDNHTDITGGRRRLVRGAAAAQVLLTRRLRRRFGEFFWSPTQGLRWNEIKDARPPSEIVAATEIEAAALGVSGIRDPRATVVLGADRQLEVTLTASWVDPEEPGAPSVDLNPVNLVL